MQTIGSQLQYLLAIDTFLQISIDDVKVLNTTIKVSKPTLERSFLFINFLIEGIQFHCTIMNLLRCTANKKAKGAKHHHGTTTHVAVHVSALFCPHDVLKHLIKQRTAIIPEQHQAQDNPTQWCHDPQQHTTGCIGNLAFVAAASKDFGY